MSETLAISLIGFVAMSITSIITLVSILFARINRLERQIKADQAYNNALWLWARDTIDKYFKWSKVGAPPLMPLPESRHDND